jgi:Flp pilus assembly pilin Flp
MHLKLSTTIHRSLTGLLRPRHGERGASLVEYGLLVALIAIVCLTAVLFFGEETSEEFSTIAKSIRSKDG